MGVTLENVEGRTQKLGLNEAIVVDYQMKFPGVPFVLKLRQALIPGGGKTFVVTCCAKADAFADRVQTFESVLASLKVPAPVPRGFNVSRILIMGLMGGAAAGVFALIKKLIAPGAQPSSAAR